MTQNESDNYPAEQINKVIVSALYNEIGLVGYQKKIIFSGGYYHKKTYDSNKLILSDEKYSRDDVLINGKNYLNKKIAQYIETDIDSAGTRHIIIMDSNYKTVSHKKFDKFGRFVGGGVYENGILIGSKEIKYTVNGVYETVMDANYKVLLNKKIDPNKYIETKSPNMTEVVLEIHVISRTTNGAIYETVYNGNNHIISAPKLIQEQKKRPPIQSDRPDPKIKSNINTKTVKQNTQSSKIAWLFSKLWQKKH
ncbi:MAG: hypothetical protein IJL05_04415 [Alphaproteobacteria bacterium]|nr:hypothetical protein [Alphaproteobacteria bacterium]